MFAALQPVVVVVSTETAARSELGAPVGPVAVDAVGVPDEGNRKERQKMKSDSLGLLKIQNLRKSFYCS